MVNLRINTMIQIEIHRLKLLGRSQRECAKLLGISRNSVRKYWDIAPIQSEEQDWPAWSKPLLWDDIHKEIDQGIPRKIIHEELSEAHDNIPTYSSFTRFYSTYIASNKKAEISLRILREPGDTIEVDYSGDGFEVLNPATGEIKKVELFVGVLTYSSLFYAEFTFSQRQEDFIRSHENMFHYFGGTTKFIVPDNCKTAVIENDGYDPRLNRAYSDLCSHYSICIDPARVRRPKDKPVVERSIGIIQQTFLARIRKKTYTSIFELNKDLRDFVDEYNHQQMQHRGHSRRELFEREKSLLKKLPKERFEIFDYKRVKVHPDCHFQLQRNFYSTPYQYVGKDIEIKFNEKIVFAFFEGEIIATHAIQRGRHKFSTNEKHYPSDKVIEINYHLGHARTSAKRISENTYFVVEKLIKAKKHPLKNLRKIQSILRLKEKYSAEALDYACTVALEHDKLFKVFIENCAKSYRAPRSTTTLESPIRDNHFICLQGDKK